MAPDVGSMLRRIPCTHKEFVVLLSKCEALLRVITIMPVFRAIE